MWRVSSKDGTRWVECHGSTWTADVVTDESMTTHAGERVERGPMAGTYQPTSKTDEVGLFLLACYLVPGPQVVGGTPPVVPPLGETYPPGTVF